MKIIRRSDFKNTLFRSLEQMSDAPEKLYIDGDFNLSSERKIITIVGSRMCSKDSIEIVQKLIAKLASYPICIVSGLAHGIDSVVHHACLASNIPTIAFPGSGLDNSVLYPSQNKKLAKQIVESNGLLVSEYEPKTKAARWTFPKRNRLMAALSEVTLVVEAKEKSGTLITARLATEYNRTVAVIPHSILNSHARGSNQLMQDGAYPILDHGDLLDLLGLKRNNLSTESQTTLAKKEQVLCALLAEPTTKQELFDKVSLSYEEFITTISQLEIKGLVEQKYGKIKLTQSNL